MKKISVLGIIILISFLLLGCDFFSREKNSVTPEIKTVELKGSISTKLEGGVPAELAKNYESYISQLLSQEHTLLHERTALPSDSNTNTVYYTVFAKKIVNGTLTEETINGELSGEDNTVNFLLRLTDGTWKVFAEGYRDSARTTKIFSGSQDSVTVNTQTNSIVIGDGTTQDDTTNPPPNYDNIEIKVFPTMTYTTQAFANSVASGNDVSLDIDIADPTIKKLVASWYIGSAIKHQTLNLSAGENTFTFTMIDDADAAGATPITKVPSGAYSVSLYFYSGSEETGDEYLSYYVTESVNVFDNMTTNSWKSSSNNAERHFQTTNGVTSFNITSNIVNSHTGTSFWVSSSGLDATSSDYSDMLGAGKPSNPFKTVQHAVNVIKSINETLWDSENGPSREFTIYIKDDLTAGAAEAFSTGANNSFVNIELPSGSGYEATSLKINIVSTQQSSSATSYPYYINANRTFDPTDTANATGTKGRALYIGTGVTVTLENIELKGGVLDESAGGNQHGAGVYVAAGGNLKINGTVKINSNKAFVSAGGSSSWIEKASNVYLPKITTGSTDSQKTIQILGTITNSDIGITTEIVPTTAGSSGAVQFTSGYATSNTQPPVEIFKNDSDGFMTGLTGTGSAQEASLVLSGGAISTPDIYEDVKFIVLDSPWYIEPEDSTTNLRWINWEDTTVTVKAQTFTGEGSSASYTDIDDDDIIWKQFIVKKGNLDVTESAGITQGTQAGTGSGSTIYTGTVTFPEFIEDGSYSLYVRAQYNDKEYGGTVKIFIEPSYQVDLLYRDGLNYFESFLQKCNTGETINVRVNYYSGRAGEPGQSPNQSGTLKTPLSNHPNVYVNLNMTSVNNSLYTLSGCKNLRKVFFKWSGYGTSTYPKAAIYINCGNDIQLYSVNDDDEDFADCPYRISDDRKSIVDK